MKNQPAPPVDPFVPAKVPIDDPIINDPIINIDLNPINAPAIDAPLKIIENADEEIFVAVEQEPEIVGGKNALYKKLKYPEKCRRAGIEGQVLLRFVVNTDGSVQDIEVVRGIGSGCDKAAINALKEVTFKPGRQRGMPVRVRFSWPILFQLK